MAVLEKTQKWLKCFVHSEAQHTWEWELRERCTKSIFWVEVNQICSPKHLAVGPVCSVLGYRCMKIRLQDALQIMPLGLAGQTMVTRMYVT